MRKLYFILSLVASSFIGFAQEAPTADPNSPEIKFDKEAIDYGTIKQDANGVRLFEFTNTGKTPLVISSATGSCGCTVPTYPKEPIMPGQKSKIEVRYDTHRVGPFSKTVTVNSNAKNPTVTLRINGTVEAVSTPTEGTNIAPVPTTAPSEIKTTSVPAPAVTKTTTTPSSVKPSTNPSNTKSTTTTKKTTTTTKKPTTTKKTTTTTKSSTK